MKITLLDRIAIFLYYLLNSVQLQMHSYSC